MRITTVAEFIKNLDNEKKTIKHRKRMISTNQLKELFVTEAKKYYALKNRQFEVDDNNKKYLDIFCKYFADDPAFETEHKLELDKGLFVYGNPGTGKTSSFKIIQKISINYSLKNLWIPLKHTNDIVQDFNLSESKLKDNVIKYYTRGKYLFDDLGSEVEASNFGKEDIFIRILEHRYNEFLNKGTKTFITSNLSFEDIKIRYGERIYDRLYQMFNQIKLRGESRRF